MIREPVVHFVVAGALLFLLDSVFGGSAEKTIVVPKNLGEAEIEGWIDEEIAYREGIERGLDRNDPEVRALIARKMRLILASQVILREPSEEELRAFFAQHQDRCDDVLRIDFTHVFVSGADAEARAQEVLALLRGGASPNGLGETFSGGRRYRGRAIADLTETFGADFTRGIDEQPTGEWILRASRFGMHAVRIDQRTGAKTTGFDAAREDVMHDWRDAERDRAVAEEMKKLRAAWNVER